MFRLAVRTDILCLYLSPVCKIYLLNKAKDMSREKILIRTSWISTIGNAVLSVSKIIVGLLAGSLAVLGDGIDSATDVIISVVMIFTARIMSRPPSKKVCVRL